MTRICHLITGLDVGGAEHALARLCPALAHRGYDQIVVTMIPGGAFAADLQRVGIPVRSLGMRRRSPSMIGFIRLARELHRFRPDILQTWMYHADLLGTLVLPFVPPTRLAWNLRSTDMGSAGGLGLKLVVKSLAALSRIPHAIVANSAAGQSEHVNAGYRKRGWSIIHNGVDTERFRPIHAERAKLRAEIGVPAESPLIGLIARVHPMKDHRTFLLAARRLLMLRPDARFLLAGLGCEAGAEPLAGMIREYGLEPHLSLLGIRSDLPRVYPALDLACLSSACGEGTPNVLLEAMACGVPCVATDVGDCRDVIGPCGRIVAPGDPAALATAWIEVLAQELANASRTRAVNQFSDSNTSARYDALYRELLGSATAVVRTAGIQTTELN